MITADRKIVSAVLKLTDNYHDEMAIGHDPSSLLLLRGHREIVKSVPLSIPTEDADEAVQRLVSADLLRIKSKWYGGYSFCMTSRLKHRHAFWWDSFSKKYIAGFISGVATTVVAGLILHFVTGLF